MTRERKPRRSIPASEKPAHIVKVSAAPAPDEPAKLDGSGVDTEDAEYKAEDFVEDGDDETATEKRYVPIIKTVEEKRLITGIVLLPNVVDAHGDIIPADVIVRAAHDFLAAYNKKTTMGLMHKNMNPPIDLVESWIAPVALSIGTTVVPMGAWIITARVNSDPIWDKVKQGKLTGFSVGGVAKVKNLIPKVA
jgi:DNA adenine methylase